MMIVVDFDKLSKPNQGQHNPNPGRVKDVEITKAVPESSVVVLQ